MQELDFYQKHLDQVSRSFAFCIQKLGTPFREWVSLSYLLCRVLDTVEDASWISQDLQDAQFSFFQKLLDTDTSKQECTQWSARFPESVPHGEKQLLNDSFLLSQDLKELPAEVRQTIQKTVGKMFRGMQFYLHRARGGSLRLLDLKDTNRYCYFVAGVVGELLSSLFLVYRKDFQPDATFKTNALHFGLFLQKVNLLKDQRSDEEQGRFLVPNRELLISSLRTNAEGSMRYLLSLPQDEKGYRTFCAWSLFLGTVSLPWIAQSFQAQDGSRIPRSVTQLLLETIESKVQDNDALMEAFEEYVQFFPESRPSIAHSEDPQSRSAWFLTLTGGELSPLEMKELGLS